MFRCAVVLAFCTFFSLGSVGQLSNDGSSEPPLAGRDIHSIKKEHVPKSEAQISIARMREPREARKLYKKALAAWVKKQPAEAQRQVEQALKIYPAFPEALSLYGVIRASLQQWDLAAEELEAAIHADPNYSPAYVILAGVYNTERRFDDAQRATQQAASTGADGWNLQYEIVRALIGQHKYESALRAANLALNARPHEGLLHLAKAHCLLGLQRYAQAVLELRTCLRYDPQGNGSQDARNLLQRIRGDAGSAE